MWRLAPSKITRVGWRLLATTATGRVCRPDPAAPGVPAAPVRSSRRARTRAPSAAPNSAIASCVWWKLTSTSSTPSPSISAAARHCIRERAGRSKLHTCSVSPGAVEDKGAQEFSPIVSNFDGEKAALSRGPQGRSHYIVGAARHNGRVGGGQLGRRCHPLSTRLVPQESGRLAIDAQETQHGIGGHQQSRAARNKKFGHPIAVYISGAVEILSGRSSTVSPVSASQATTCHWPSSRSLKRLKIISMRPSPLMSCTGLGPGE